MQIAIAIQHMSDIRGATRGSECDCPIARALNRRFGIDWQRLYRGVSVSGSGKGMAVARFNVLKAPLTIELPPEAVSFIKRFDCREFVEPITFVIEVPEALGLLAQSVPALPAGGQA